jgi:hypothetical protein
VRERGNPWGNGKGTGGAALLEEVAREVDGVEKGEDVGK